MIDPSYAVSFRICYSSEKSTSLVRTLLLNNENENKDKRNVFTVVSELRGEAYFPRKEKKYLPYLLSPQNRYVIARNSGGRCNNKLEMRRYQFLSRLSEHGSKKSKLIKITGINDAIKFVFLALADILYYIMLPLMS